MAICNLCGYEWVARVNDPKQCPRCKRYDFEKKEGEKDGSIKRDFADIQRNSD